MSTPQPSNSTRLSTSLPTGYNRSQLTSGGRVGRSYFHLHLVSDSTGETLIAASRAAAAQYQGVASIEHVYPLVRTAAGLDRVIAEIENAQESFSLRSSIPTFPTDFR